MTTAPLVPTPQVPVPGGPLRIGPLRIGPLTIPTPVVLAPMAGVTNAPFRDLCRSQGAGLYVSEMIAARGLVEGHDKTHRLARFGDGETPRSIQLYGTDPAVMGDAVRRLVGELGAEHVDRSCDSLSLGERTRAALAVLQGRAVNVVVLDEPTNHLDAAAIDQLQDALTAFTGTLLIVSHDRTLLDALAPLVRWEFVRTGSQAVVKVG